MRIGSNEFSSTVTTDRPTLLLPFDPETTFFLLQKLERSIGFPAVISPMLGFPEVFVLIIVSLLFLFIDTFSMTIDSIMIFLKKQKQLYGFLCFAAEIWQLPLIFCFAVFVNGT
jgi:hypothetical protein